MMIDHTSLGVRNYTQAVTFYTACLAPLGYAPQRVQDDEAAFGTPEAWGFFLYPAQGSLVGDRAHIAFSAPAREAVETFHREAASRGATTVRPPGPRPDISPEYYGTVVKDADGHTLEAVFWAR